MYVATQRVSSLITGRQGVNTFLYLHGPGVALALPEQNPGALVWQYVDINPPGNRVLSYLDILAPDAITLDQLSGYLSGLKHVLVQGGNPTTATWGPLWIRFGLAQRGIPWQTELGALAGHVVLRLPAAWQQRG